MPWELVMTLQIRTWNEMHDVMTFYDSSSKIMASRLSFLFEWGGVDKMTMTNDRPGRSYVILDCEMTVPIDNPK